MSFVDIANDEVNSDLLLILGDGDRSWDILSSTTLSVFGVFLTSVQAEHKDKALVFMVTLSRLCSLLLDIWLENVNDMFGDRVDMRFINNHAVETDKLGGDLSKVLDRFAGSVMLYLVGPMMLMWGKHYHLMLMLFHKLDNIEDSSFFKNLLVNEQNDLSNQLTADLQIVINDFTCIEVLVEWMQLSRPLFYSMVNRGYGDEDAMKVVVKQYGFPNILEEIRG